MKAIQTEYKGYKFRSRLEARWVVFFETLGIEWQYEPEGFVLKNEGYYLPDFYFPEYDFFGEVKGILTKDEEEKHEAFVETLEKQLFIFHDFDQPPERYYVGKDILHCFDCGDVLGWHNTQYHLDCTTGRKDIVMKDDAIPFYEFIDSTHSPIWVCADPAIYHDHILSSSKYYSAIENAKQARFEHGETPSV